MRKFLVYLLLFVVCIAGTTCIIYVYEDSTRVSASVGKPNYVNAYEDFQLYHYDLTDEYFYLDKKTDLYTLNKSYPVETEFNGEEYSYNIMLNNVPCYRMSTSAGKLYSEFNITYKDLNNEPIGSTYLTIEFNFYVNEVAVKVTASNDDNYGRFLEYLKINGLKLDIVEGQLNDIQLESTTFDGYYVKVLNADGSINKVFYCKDGALVIQAMIPTVGGTNLRQYDITLENGQHQRQIGWTDGETVYETLSPDNFSENITLTPYFENYYYVDYYVPFIEDMTVYDIYARNKYDIKPGESHTLLTYYPELEGYTFLGWSLDKENVLTDLSIVVNEDINLYAVYEVVDNGPVVFADMTLNELVEGGYLTFSNGTLSSTTSFSSLSSGELVIPEEVTTIAQTAFKSKKNITGVDMSASSVTTIGYSAFEECTYITYFSFSNCLENVYYNAFYNCKKVAKYTFPNTLKTIGNRAFYGCSNLKSIYFGTSLTSLGQGVFANSATSFTSVFIPISCTSIGANCFDSRTSLYFEAETFNYSHDGSSYYGYSYDEYLVAIS